MQVSELNTVAIYGCGTIGASWAALFAARGGTAECPIREVRLFDITPAALETGHRRVTTMLGDFPGLTPAQRTTALARIRPCATPAELLDGAQWVQESVLERYPIKREAHNTIEKYAAPAAIIASSSSGLLASTMQEGFAHPARFLIGHPFNPPHLIPLVELVPGPATDPSVVETAHAFYTALGKIPITLRKEVPGHIANRLAAAVWREALDLVDRGVASLEDVDKALYAGPGLRWALMGQHLIYHLNGGPKGYAGFFDQFESQFAVYFDDLAAWKRIPESGKKEILRQIEHSYAGRSVADMERWRDQRLAQMTALLYGPSAPENPGA